MYFVTGLEKLELNENETFVTGSTRCFGYYQNKSDAFNIVKENSYNINEFTYDYVVIEKINEGVHSYCIERWFFRFDYSYKKYSLIEEPKIVKHYVNFSIG